MRGDERRYEHDNNLKKSQNFVILFVHYALLFWFNSIINRKCMPMHFIDKNIPNGKTVVEGDERKKTHRRSEEFENHKFLEIFHEIDISNPNNEQFSLSAANKRRRKKAAANFCRLKFNERECMTQFNWLMIYEPGNIHPNTINQLALFTTDETEQERKGEKNGNNSTINFEKWLMNRVKNGWFFYHYNVCHVMCMYRNEYMY